MENSFGRDGELLATLAFAAAISAVYAFGSNGVDGAAVRAITPARPDDSFQMESALLACQLNTIMRIIDIFESLDDITEDDLKFWYHPGSGKFIPHDLDTHHSTLVASNPGGFNVNPAEFSDNPHVPGSETQFGDPEEDEELWSEEDADEDDRPIKAALETGWVRGGHKIDLLRYFDMNQIHHDGIVYLEGYDRGGMRKAVREVIRRWPDIQMVEISFGDDFYHLEGDEIDRFVRRGTLPVREATGRVVNGVNTTVDVGPDEIQTQAAKMGFTVDPDGVPPTVSKEIRHPRVKGRKYGRPTKYLDSKKSK